jgi:hypothetical protein
MAQNIEGYNQHPPVIIPIQQNIPIQPVRQNKNNDKMCFGNKGSFMCITISYILAFICEQLTMENRIPGIVLGVLATIIGFPGPIFILYPTIKTFNNQNPRRKEGFAQRMIIGLVCYVATIIVATILIMNAVHEETSVQGLAVVCSSLLGYAGLIFYIDQPEFNGNI